MDQDIVTGASVEVSVEVTGTPPQIWDLVTDITRIGEWSPECVDAWWSDAEHAFPRSARDSKGTIDTQEASKQPPSASSRGEPPQQLHLGRPRLR